MPRIPHPIPYQGSKRRLAQVILEHAPENTHTLIEPFGGSAALTLAAAAHSMARRHYFGDYLEPLVGIWRQILSDPHAFADAYETLWQGQVGDPESHYLGVRDEFNKTRKPVLLLYLLARCVKNAVRFSTSGGFNQSADHRRSGMHPKKMRTEIMGAHAVLRGKADTFSGDYASMLDTATSNDLVYMDPPYQGVSGRDHRYVQQLDFDRLMANLEKLNSRNVPFLLSFDGTCGDKEYGRPLPSDLNLTQVLIHTGKSSQATLNGELAETVESLYLSPAIKKRGKDFYSLAAPEPLAAQLSLL